MIFKDLKENEFFEFEFNVYKRVPDDGPWNAIRLLDNNPSQFEDEEFVRLVEMK